jgi:hypothetical protein
VTLQSICLANSTSLNNTTTRPRLTSGNPTLDRAAAVNRAYRAQAQDAERSVRAIVNEHEKVTHEQFGLGIKYEPTTE